MIKEKIKNIKNKFFKNKKLENKRNKIIFSVILILGFLNIFLIIQNYNLNSKLIIKHKQEKLVKINIKFYWEDLILKNYSEVRYKLQAEWKHIIENIRNLHKSPVLIAREFQNKELCAGYISELSQKIWWKKSIYSIWMQNTKKRKLAQAWELPYFYEAFWWKVLIDLGKKFNVLKKDYIENINSWNLKEFFAKAFLEEAIFWDIWFLYSKTKYTKFLKTWSSNSHIAKNMWISDFEIVFSKFDSNKSNLELLMNNFWCSSEFGKYISLLENYELHLNKKRIIFYNNDFYYLLDNNILGDKVKFKYLDKITYKDITLAHFFEWKSHVDSLFQFTCNLEFYPINVMNINWRMIEKM